MIVTILSLFAALETGEPAVTPAATISLVPAAERFYLELEIREDGALIASPSVEIVEGQTASLSVGGPDGYRIDLTAEPSPVVWYAPQAADDVFVSSRLFMPQAGTWQRVGDSVVSIEPGQQAATELDVSAASRQRAGDAEPVSRLSVSYRMSVLTN